MDSTAKKIKETFMIGTLNIVLPTADVGTDGKTIYELYTGLRYHPNCTRENSYKDFHSCLADIPDEALEYETQETWATMLLVPFLLNYLAGWYAWYRLDKKKRFTWTACLVGLYPQMRAASVIRELWRAPMRGFAKKRKFDRQMSEPESFLEAIPTSFIMVHIFRQSYGDIQPSQFVRKSRRISSQLSSLSSLVISVISASLGMAKFLKVSKRKSNFIQSYLLFEYSGGSMQASSRRKAPWWIPRPPLPPRPPGLPHHTARKSHVPQRVHNLCQHLDNHLQHLGANPTRSHHWCLLHLAQLSHSNLSETPGTLALATFLVLYF